MTEPLPRVHARSPLFREEMNFHRDTADTTHTDTAATTSSTVTAATSKIQAPLPNHKGWVDTSRKLGTYRVPPAEEEYSRVRSQPANRHQLIPVAKTGCKSGNSAHKSTWLKPSYTRAKCCHAAGESSFQQNHSQPRRRCSAVTPPQQLLTKTSRPYTRMSTSSQESSTSLRAARKGSPLLPWVQPPFGVGERPAALKLLQTESKIRPPWLWEILPAGRVFLFFFFSLS